MVLAGVNVSRDLVCGFISACSNCLRFSFRTASDSTGHVSNKNPPLHRPAELKVLGGSTYCKSYDRLLKTQV